MTAPENQSTIRTITGKDVPISGWVVNVDDPLQIGRVQVCPDNFDPTKVRAEDCPWCHIEDPGAQTWVGSTKHTSLRPGHRVGVQFDPDGTGHIRRSPTSQSGAEPAAGSGQASSKGQSTYPGSTTDTG